MQVVIQEITAKDFTGNRFDAQDPCVVIQIGKSSIETPRYTLSLSLLPLLTLSHIN